MCVCVCVCDYVSDIVMIMMNSDALCSSEMVKVLVAHGASIDLRGGSDSWTPLMYSAMAGM